MSKALLWLVTVTLVVVMGWRVASRRRSLPCPVWLRWMVELDNPFTKTNRAAEIIGHLALAPGMRVLDAGCGPGRVTVPAATAVGPTGEVVAMDLQRGMLVRAEAKARAAGVMNIRFLRAGLGEGALQKEWFDRALLVTVLGEVPDREGALREIFAALKPGGILSVTEIVFDPHFQRRATVERLGKAVGFEVKTFFGNRIAFTLHLRRPC